jgi:hypothetical protein
MRPPTSSDMMAEFVFLQLHSQLINYIMLLSIVTLHFLDMRKSLAHYIYKDTSILLSIVYFMANERLVILLITLCT